MSELNSLTSYEEEKFIRDWMNEVRLKLKKMLTEEKYKLEFLNEKFKRDIELIYKQIMFRYSYFKENFQKILEEDLNRARILSQEQLDTGYKGKLKKELEVLEIAYLNMKIDEKKVSPQEKKKLISLRGKLIQKHSDKVFEDDKKRRELSNKISEASKSLSELLKINQKTPSYGRDFKLFLFTHFIIKVIPIVFSLIATFFTVYTKLFFSLFQQFMIGRSVLYANTIFGFVISILIFGYIAKKLSERITVSFLSRQLKIIDDEEKKFYSFVDKVSEKYSKINIVFVDPDSK